MTTYQLVGLPLEPFAALFALGDRQLRERGAKRVIATAKPGFPCRVSLKDAEVGEELLLLPHEHLSADSPYRASGPIFVRRNAVQRVLAPGELTSYVTRRLISVRAYDADHLMIGAEVCEGPAVAAELQRQFNDARVTYIHLHNARPGCYSCLVQRC